MRKQQLPPEFDPGFYRTCKPYLANAPDSLLAQEFREFGIKSGTPGSFLCYRENVRNFLNEAADSILEIGPGAQPDFRGPHVKYLDVFTTAQLRERYAGNETPEIEYSLSQLVNESIPERFDAVYSAHNFEHQVNPVRHIQSVGKLLNPNGLFVAVIPDKNFTFDYFRETSTLTDVLSSPDTQTEHSLKSRLERFNRTHNNCYAHWFGNHGVREETDEEILSAYATRNDPVFMSLHVGIYEPESFKRIFGLLSRKDMLGLELLRVYNTPFLRNEFVTIFRKTEMTSKPLETGGHDGQ